MAFLTAPDGARLHYAVEGDGQPLVLHLGAGCYEHDVPAGES